MFIARVITALVLVLLSALILYHVTTAVHGMMNPVKSQSTIKMGALRR